MTDDDFYVDDETPEEFEAGWREGERGITSGPRDPDQRARSIVERAVRGIEAPSVETIRVDSKGWFGDANVVSIPAPESLTEAETREGEPVNA